MRAVGVGFDLVERETPPAKTSRRPARAPEGECSRGALLLLPGALRRDRLPVMPAYPEELLKKYVGVHNLAEQSNSDGERAAAGTTRARLEEKYPGLGLEALRWDDAQKRAARGEPPSTPPPRDSAGASPGGSWWTGNPPSEGAPSPAVPPGVKPSNTPWGSWGDVLGTAFKAAQGITETVINAEAGRQFADSCVSLEQNRTRAGIVRITASVSFADLITAKARLNDAQKQAFARAIGERISARLYAFLIG